MKPVNHRVLRKYIKDDTLNYFTNLYLKSLNIHLLYYRKTKKYFFTLENNQIGGDKKYVTINKNRYEFELDIYDDNIDKDNKRKQITIVNLENEGIDCGIIIVDKQTNEGNIQNVSNYKSCFKCIEQNNNYKVGDIIMQILIALGKQMKLKKLSLEDTSMLTCNKIRIPLISLRTITYGEPYYCKFGFRPVNKGEIKVYNYNKKLFNTNPTIKKDDLIKIILNLEVDKKTIKYFYSNIIKISNDDIVIKDFFNILIDKTIKNSNNEYCKFLNQVHHIIYNKIGYKLYDEKVFEFKI